MQITVVCVGKMKERFYREAVSEYEKRLGRYTRLQILEVADEPTPDGAGASLEEQIREKEASRILARIREDQFVCTLEIQGKRFDSVAFSRWLERGAADGFAPGKRNLCFVIGGSLGLHESVRKRSDFALSFSDMTFPHQLMRVILLEQIYRGCRIMHGEPYHK